MLYKDYLGLKKVESQQLFTIQSQDKQISSLLKQNAKYAQNDSIANVRFKNDSILIRNFEGKFKANKRAKIAASISVPVAAVLSFLLAWHLHR